MAGAMLGGFVGYLVADFMGMIVGGLVLGIAFMIPTLKVKKHSARKPPAVRPVSSAPKPAPKPPTDETTCPDCAETIKSAAKVCKHCGFRIAPA